MSLRILIGALLLTFSHQVFALQCPSVQTPLPSPTGLIPGYNDPRPPYEWAGAFQACPVTLLSRRTGARLYAVLHFPPDIEQSSRHLPAVVIGPGSGQGVQANYQWLARYLAGNGFVALTVDPQGVGYSEITALQGSGAPGLEGIPFQQLGNYIDAMDSGMSFLASEDNPVLAWTRVVDFGLAGHSLSARAASTLQADDMRVATILAMDNLSSNREGDAGIMSGGGLTGGLAGGEVSLTVTSNLPRVPALALASDQSPWVDPNNTDPELKKTGFSAWRAAGTPAMVLVFSGSAHSDFSRKPGDDLFVHQLAAHYALAWFDWQLRASQEGLKGLFAASMAGSQRDEFLSTTFRSAAFFPHEQIDCGDLLAQDCFPTSRVDGMTSGRDDSARGGCAMRSGSFLPDPLMPALVLASALFLCFRQKNSGGCSIRRGSTTKAAAGRNSC